MIARIDFDREHMRRAGPPVGGDDRTREDHAPDQESERPDPAPEPDWDNPVSSGYTPMGCHVVLISVKASMKSRPWAASEE